MPLDTPLAVAPSSATSKAPAAGFGPAQGNPTPAAPAVAPVPSAPPEPAVSPTVNPEFSNVGLPVSPKLGERYYDLQEKRTAIKPPVWYRSPSSQIVWWFDPVFGSFVAVSEVKGDFPVQATFRFRGQWVTCLEIGFDLANPQAGIAVPPEIVERMKTAGTPQYVSLFVYQTKDINPR